ncbi:MAG: vWA domain-containing protein [Candidatus Aenigmatarchaeota archaeon]
MKGVEKKGNGKKKGQTSLLIKGIYIILVLVSIAIFINRIFFSNLASAQQERNLLLKNRANRLLDVLAGDVRCLAYKEKGSLENRIIELSSHRILDKRKLDDFLRFSEIQPDCARDFDFGYRVDVETFPLKISSAEVGKKEGVFGKLLSLIDGKKVVFVLDVSGSMGDPGGKCDVDVRKNTKICCLKLFIYGFIEKMSDDSEIAVIPYGDENDCDPKLLFPFTKLNSFSVRENLKSKISSLYPYDKTPMAPGLKKGFEYAISNGGQAIVLLTDGIENMCGSSIEIANNYKSTNIPVYTVAYGSEADVARLEEIASITNGQFFDARTCEELVSQPRETLEVEIPSMTWEFGDLEFSEKEALRLAFSISVPINVFIDGTTTIPGKMTIRIVDGELEEFRGFLDRSCLTNTDFQNIFTFHYPISLEPLTNKICLEIEGKKICQKLACNKKIEFSSLSPGRYKIYTKNLDNVLEVIV